jgi:S-formylglutathione hydrolase FrmB
MATAFVAGNTVSRADPPSPAQLVTITIPDTNGEIPAQWLGYPGPPRADVLLPAGYDPSRQYPLLVFLNGLNGNYASSAAGLMSFDIPAIVVMPEGGNGWFADWWNNGQRGAPAWESYELNDVIPTILARYPILPQRQYHAIAGTSMGGLGAVYLAGRLPGFFGSVATLSGFVDPQWFGAITEPAMSLTSYLLMANANSLGWVLNPNAVEGPPAGFYADGHNPALLAENLGQTRVFESTGTGVPSQSGLASLTSPTAVANLLVGSAEEGPIIYPMNQLYHQALTNAGVDVTYQVHTGGHDSPDFEDEFKAMFDWGLFNPVAAAPQSWANETVAKSGQLWDVGYRFNQAPNRVVEFRRSGNQVSVGAAGSAVSITTANGCVITSATPATITNLDRSC